MMVFTGWLQGCRLREIGMFMYFDFSFLYKKLSNYGEEDV
jgi:hypothetical protein